LSWTAVLMDAAASWMRCHKKKEEEKEEEKEEGE
jgi:hypothetical protein